MGECTWWLWRRRARAPSAARAARRHRRGGHGARPAARLGRPRRAEPAERPQRSARSRGSRSSSSSSSPWPPCCPPHRAACWPWSLGAILSVLVLVKVLDIGFFTAFDRPFRPLDDSSYVGIGIETLGEAIGTSSREPRRRRRGRAHPRDPRHPGPGAAARDAGRGRPARLGAPGGGGARRGLGGPSRRRRAGRLLERRRPGRRRGAGGARPPWQVARRSPARSPTTASAPLPATGC